MYFLARKNTFYLKTITLLIHCLLPGILYAAETSDLLINYGREQGFVAENGYGLGQDSKGYIWIGTENGLMRFNGYEFRLYTTRDGLPDNEVLGIKEDSMGRLWINAYASAICYILNNKVYHSGNDETLRRLNFQSFTVSIEPDRHGAVWFRDQRGLIAMDKNGRLIWPKQEGPKTIGYDRCFNIINKRGDMMVIEQKEDNAVYIWKDSTFKLIGHVPFPLGYMSINAETFYNATTGYFCRYQVSDSAISFGPLRKGPQLLPFYRLMNANDSTLMLCTTDGVKVLDMASGKQKAHYFQGTPTGAVLKAKDGTLWFGTIGRGLFCLRHTPVKSAGNSGAIEFIKGTDQAMYYTTNSGIFTISTPGATAQSPEISCLMDNGGSRYGSFRYVGQNSHGQWISCTGNINLHNRICDKKIKHIFTNTIKDVLEEDSTHLLIASSTGVYRLDKDRFCIETILADQQRTLALAKRGDVVYMATLNGLMAAYPDGRCLPVSAHPSLRTHIAALSTGRDSSLWVANNKAEVIILYGERVNTVIDLKNGLRCNSIYCMKVSGNLVWVGTDNGVFAISQIPPYPVIRHITYANGLNSNQVTCLDVYRKKVWVGTSRGINYFDEDAIFSPGEKAKFVVNEIRNDTVSMLPSQQVLSLRNKGLHIDFDVLDFSGGSRPLIQYRLDGQPWAELRINSLDFPALPYGPFRLELRAFSSNQPEAILFSQQFYHPYPFYLRWWFFLLAGLFLVGATALLFFFLSRRTQQKHREKLQVQQSLLRLEQMALQGQMNPHFIFNCIIALKQYYQSGETERADRFTEAFSQLIRQTFEMGTKTLSTLDQELDYLSQYLQVEQERFNQSFQYSIERPAEIPGQQIMIPAMLLQPLVENAVRHGVRHLAPGNGRILVRVLQVTDQVHIIISDNGIGREASAAFRAPYAYTSSTVNEKRLYLLNRLFDGRITMNITDLRDEKGNAAGTTVLITYPVYLNDLLNHEDYYH